MTGARVRPGHDLRRLLLREGPLAQGEDHLRRLLLAAPLLEEHQRGAAPASSGTQQGHRVRDEPRDVHVPAQDHQHPVVGQAVVVGLEGLDGVEMVLGERQAARGHGGPGVDEPEQDHVESAVGAADEGAALGEDGLHLRVVVEVARLRPEVAHEAEHEGVQLHRGDLLAARTQGHEHVGAAAGTDDQGLGALGDELEGQGPIPVAGPGHALKTTVPAQDAGPGVGVDVEPGQVGVGEARHRVDA